jgi:hypothetical protein
VLAHTRALKLPGVARVFESVARQARDAHWPHEDYLQEVLSAELASRHESVIRQRLRDARFPEVKTLDTFDFTAAEGVSATQIHTLARGEWVTAPENLIFAIADSRGCGSPGTRTIGAHTGWLFAPRVAVGSCHSARASRGSLETSG